MRGIKYVLLPLIVFTVIYILIFQPEVLSIQLYSKLLLPLGTMISWCAIICISLFFYLISPSDNLVARRIKKILFFNMVLAFLWGVFSYFLSGNWAFSFSNNQIGFKIWVIFSLIVVLLPLIIFTFKLLIQAVNKMHFNK